VTNSEVSSRALSTARKILVRRGARTLFGGIWAFGLKVIEFQSFLWIEI